MAHLWVHQSSEWAVLPLERTPLLLTDVQRAAGVEASGTAEPATDGTLARSESGNRPEWHLFARPTCGIAVNGLPLLTGMRTLVDRDEIRVPGLGPLYFSTERIARLEPLPEFDRDMICPRCRQRIQTGVAAVWCPGCDLWHHESAELPCWTYAPTCAFCQHPTGTDAGFRWTPEGN